MSKARRLLEAIIGEASAFSEYNEMTDDAFRSIVKLAKEAITLAQPEPAAREAAVLEVAEELADQLVVSVEGKGLYCELCDRWFSDGHLNGCTVERLYVLVADTSPAAAALLAQGERLREEEGDLHMVAAHLELLNEPGVSDYLVDALFIIRRVLKARAALAPGEPDAN